MRRNLIWRKLRWLTWRLPTPLKVEIYDGLPFVMWRRPYNGFTARRLWPSQAVVDAHFAYETDDA